MHQTGFVRCFGGNMNKKEVAVFGMGSYFTWKEKSIIGQYEIVAFLKSKPESDDYEWNGKIISVYTPREYAELYADSQVLIMVSQKLLFEVLTCLLESGFREEQLIFGGMLEPSFDVTERLLLSERGSIYVKNKGIGISFGGKETIVRNQEEYQCLFRELLEQVNPFACMIKKMELNPISEKFARDLGKPIDRYYMENFIKAKSQCIHGEVMEVGETLYTYQFGNNIHHSIVLHVEGINNTLKGNLETGEGIFENMADCFVCTQTIQMIFDLNKVMRNIYKLLKSGGSALITMHGLSQISMGDYLRWGEYWRMTPKAARELALRSGFAQEDIEVVSYGNVKTAICFLMGICQEQLSNEDLDYCDEKYPIIVAMRCKKR